MAIVDNQPVDQSIGRSRNTKRAQHCWLLLPVGETCEHVTPLSHSGYRVLEEGPYRWQGDGRIP